MTTEESCGYHQPCGGPAAWIGYLVIKTDYLGKCEMAYIAIITMRRSQSSKQAGGSGLTGLRKIGKWEPWQGDTGWPAGWLGISASLPEAFVPC